MTTDAEIWRKAQAQSKAKFDLLLLLSKIVKDQLEREAGSDDYGTHDLISQITNLEEQIRNPE